MRADLWTDERKDEVRRLWDDGWSATQIGAMLKPRVSRNAVIGIVHRNKDWDRGIHQPAPPHKPREPKPKKASKGVFTLSHPWRGKPLKPTPLPPQKAALPTEGTVAYLLWRHGQCHFPMWGDSGFDPHASMFCGRAVEGESPYCVHHRRVCSDGIPKRKAA